MSDKKNPTAYGLWHVTTEGDVEGRSICDLGTHEGYLDEIALSLAGSATYGLRFSAMDPSGYKGRIPRTEVNVSLDIDTRTWDMTREKRIEYFRKMLRDRPVVVLASDYYASVKLVDGSDPRAQEEARRNATKQAALAKLSPEEMEALGLK